MPHDSINSELTTSKERLLQGGGFSAEADKHITHNVMAYTARSRTPMVRVWQPERQVAFGPQDVHSSDYDDARSTAIREGFTPVERTVGGHAVAYTGSTVAWFRSCPIDAPKKGVEQRYETMMRRLRHGLHELGVVVETGEPDQSFCPGSYSLQANGKLAGVAQRIKKKAALVSGIVIVNDHREIAQILSHVYDDLDLSFDPGTVGSLSKAGVISDPDVVIRRLEESLTLANTPAISDVDAFHQ